MRIPAAPTTVSGRARPVLLPRAAALAACALAAAAFAGSAVSPTRASATGSGCTSGGGVLNSCILVTGTHLHVQSVSTSMINVHPRTTLEGRFHVWGPGGFQLTKPVSYRSGWDEGQTGWTWIVNRNVKPGPLCAQFEVSYGANGWQRYGNGPACLTVHY